MAGASLTATARREIRAIHKQSQRLNRARGREHAEVLLALARKHAQEISERYSRADSHYLVETGDLLILCLEILLEAGADADEMLTLCYGRYRAKLEQLRSSQDAAEKGES